MSEEELQEEYEEIRKEIESKTEEEREELENKKIEEEEKYQEEWTEEHQGEVDEEGEPDDLIEFTEEDIKSLVEELLDGFDDLFREGEETYTPGMAAATAIGYLKNAFNVIKNLTAPVRERINKKKWGERLLNMKAIFEGSAAMLTTGSFIFTGDDGTKKMFEELREELKEIKVEIQKVADSVKSGFDDLIAHDSFRDFRERVMEPTAMLYDRYMDCFIVMGDIPLNEFLTFCNEKYHPRDVLTVLRTFLDTDNNIFMDQLASKDYDYKTYQMWFDAVYDHAIKLHMMVHYYYGLTYDQNQDFLKRNLDSFNMKFTEMINRLDKIEVDRLKFFHEKGLAVTKLKEVFDEIVGDYPGENWGPKYLSDLAIKLKDKWKETNGLQHFYVALVRGRYSKDESILFRSFNYYIGDKEKVTVLPNAAFETEGTHAKNEGISIVLVQPLTAEMVKAHKEALTQENIGKIAQLMTSSFKDQQGNDAKLSKIQEDLIAIKTPLFITFSTEQTGLVRAAGCAQQTKMTPFRMVGEFSTTPTGWLRTLKLEQFVAFTIVTNNLQQFSIPLKILVQVVFA